MTRHFTALAIFIAFATAAQAQTVTVWQGSIQLVSVNAACLADGYKKGQYFTSVFRPANIDDNGPDTRLTVVGNRSMHRMNFPAQDLQNAGTYNGRYLSSRGGHDTWSGSYENAKVAPTSLSNSSHVVIITAKINDFWATTGCSVIIRGTYSRRLK